MTSATIRGNPIHSGPFHWLIPTIHNPAIPNPNGLQMAFVSNARSVATVAPGRRAWCASVRPKGWRWPRRLASRLRRFAHCMFGRPGGCHLCVSRKPNTALTASFWIGRHNRARPCARCTKRDQHNVTHGPSGPNCCSRSDHGSSPNTTRHARG